MKYFETNYYFARLHLIAIFDDKYRYLIDTFNRGKKISKRDFEWGFFNVEEIAYEGIPFVSGFLVKYKLLKDEDIVDESSKMLTKTFIENRVIETSQFFIHPKSGIIAFHPIQGKIGHNQFRHIFAELIKVNNDNVFVDAEVDFINEEIKILEAIKSFEKIFLLSIELHPSNPSFRERWKKTDIKLKAMEAEGYKQVYHSKKGLILDENGEPFGDILMAGDGYGKAEIKGLKDGEIHTASTEETPLIIKGLGEGKPIEILRSVFNTYQKIWERVRN